MAWLKQILAKFEQLNYILGEIVEVCREIRGFNGGSIQWRTKQTQRDHIKFISARIRPSYYYGFTSNLNCFLNLDLDEARKLRDDLARMIKTVEAEAPLESPYK